MIENIHWLGHDSFRLDVALGVGDGVDHHDVAFFVGGDLDHFDVALVVDDDLFHDLNDRRGGGSGLHVDGLRALTALLDLILDEHVLVDRGDAVGEAGDVHEDVVVVVLLDEAESLLR